MSRTTLLFVLTAGLVAAVSASTAAGPEQIHIAVGANPSEMAVMWVTQMSSSDHLMRLVRGVDDTPPAVVRYGLSESALSQTTTGKSAILQDGGHKKRQIVTYTVRLTGLVVGTTYHYQVGDGQSSWSDVKSFTTLPADPNARPIRYIVYGDLGLENGVSLAPIANDVKTLAGADKIDVVTHIGDFAYDLHDHGGKVGDEFMRQVEPFASAVPYMVSPGNHEEKYDFSHYTARFEGMPYPQAGTPNNWYYSYNIGLVHWVSISTEVYFHSHTADARKAQYAWLEADLRQANANRAAVPWIIMVGHRMMYCSCASDRLDEATVVREGVNGEYGLEDLAHKYGVDIYAAGHNHNTERMYPVYKSRVESQDHHVFKNPTAMVHLVIGAAGGKEKIKDFGKIGDYSAYQSLKYGYSRITVHNATHLYYEMVEAENPTRLAPDHMWLVQERHGPHTGANAVHRTAVGPQYFETTGMREAQRVEAGMCPRVRVCRHGKCFCTEEAPSPRGAGTVCEEQPCGEEPRLRASILI